MNQDRPSAEYAVAYRNGDLAPHYAVPAVQYKVYRALSHKWFWIDILAPWWHGDLELWDIDWQSKIIPVKPTY